MAGKFKPFLGSGDNGWTDLLGGKRVHKTNLKISINSLIDELNSLLGVIKTKIQAQETGHTILDISRRLREIQKDLMLISGSIAGLKADKKIKQVTDIIEHKISNISRKLPIIKKFIIPGKTEIESLIHLARSRARIIELLLWKAKLKTQAVYFNRLSDYLFLMARFLSTKAFKN